MRKRVLLIVVIALAAVPAVGHRTVAAPAHGTLLADDMPNITWNNKGA